MKQRASDNEISPKCTHLPRMREELGAERVGPVQRGLLVEIDRLTRRYGATYTRELARCTGKQPGETSDRLKALRQRGLIEDAPDGVRDNHGARMVRLTKEGKEALQ